MRSSARIAHKLNHWEHIRSTALRNWCKATNVGESKNARDQLSIARERIQGLLRELAESTY